MKHRNIIFLALALSVTGLIASLQSCKHDPPLIVNDGGGNGGGGNGGGGNGGGGGGGTGSGIPCDPDTVYFEQQILPILASNCAMSGCHDAASAQDDIILISYTSTMSSGIVDSGNVGNSQLYEVITETDPGDIMPPPPAAPLTSQQIALIATWINQGAQNLTCNPNYGSCDSTNVTYNGTVKPIIQAKCQGCHNSTNTGGGVNLSNYAGVQASALNGSLVGSITHAPGWSAMPQNTNQLPSCEIAQIRNWVLQGAQNN